MNQFSVLSLDLLARREVESSVKAFRFARITAASNQPLWSSFPSSASRQIVAGTDRRKDRSDHVRILVGAVIVLETKQNPVPN